MGCKCSCLNNFFDKRNRKKNSTVSLPNNCEIEYNHTVDSKDIKEELIDVNKNIVKEDH